MKNLKSFNQLNEAAKVDWAAAAANTKDAYSFERYKEGEWEKIAKFLSDKGYNQQDIEDILNSKIMRFVADKANKAQNMTAALFKKNFDAQEERQIDSMIRKELHRVPKTGAESANPKLAEFKSELSDLMAKYKGKVSDADMATVLQDTLSHKI